MCASTLAAKFHGPCADDAPSPPLNMLAEWHASISTTTLTPVLNLKRSLAKSVAV